MIVPAPTLGRNCIVAPGQAAPPGWEGVERIVIDPADGELARSLHERADHRVACVFELSAEADDVLRRPSATSRPPHELGPRLPMPRELVRHLVIANSVDHRGAAPSWPLHAPPPPPAHVWVPPSHGPPPCVPGGPV